MDKESVDSMFKDYQGCKARCRYLEACILKAEAELEEMRLTIIEDNIHITASLTGLPGRQKGSADPTGHLGDKVAGGWQSEQMKQIEAEIETYRREIRQKSITISFVDAWIEVLMLKERFVIEKKLLGGLSWRQLLHPFEKEFGDYYSTEGLRLILRAGMKKIYAIAE